MIEHEFVVANAPFATLQIRIGVPNTGGCSVELVAGAYREGPYPITGTSTLHAMLAAMVLAVDRSAALLDRLDARIDSPVWKRLQRLRSTDADRGA